MPPASIHGDASNGVGNKRPPLVGPEVGPLVGQEVGPWGSKVNKEQDFHPQASVGMQVVERAAKEKASMGMQTIERAAKEQACMGMQAEATAS